MRIKKITGRQIYDSRGNPTVEAEITLEDGSAARGIAPSGASTGMHEALELRDGIEERFRGKSVFKAVNNINNAINSTLKGLDVSDQAKIDLAMIGLDGSTNKKNLGANAMLAVSIAAARAAAQVRRIPLYEYLSNGHDPLIPMPMIQIIGGGLHAGNATDIQDFLIIPISAKSFSEAMEMTFGVYQATRDIYKKMNLVPAVADEGGFWPSFDTNEKALEILTDAIKNSGYSPRNDIGIALDVAASHFWDGTKYRLSAEKRELTPSAFIDLQERWVDKYPVISLEDCCAEDDWDGWELVTKRLGRRIQIIGDDLFTTNIQRIQKGIDRGICNSVLIKMNQIGTLTETIEALELTRSAGYLPVVSARSGETEDTTIVDLCIGQAAGQLKVGSITRSERLVKYNEVLRFEEKLGDKARFAGKEIFKNIIN